ASASWWSATTGPSWSRATAAAGTWSPEARSPTSRWSRRRTLTRTWGVRGGSGAGPSPPKAHDLGLVLRVVPGCGERELTQVQRRREVQGPARQDQVSPAPAHHVHEPVQRVGATVLFVHAPIIA